MSVLADGKVLLDGQPAGLPELHDAFDGAKKSGTVVWYYREKCADEPPPVALEILKFITDARLPVRLSSKPDFSDAVAPVNRLGQEFARIRERASQRKMVILRPDRQYLLLPALDRSAVPPQALAAVERMLPPAVKRNVAVIADTSWTTTNAPNMTTANEAIPFFGLLMGFVTIGHAVWIFDASTIDALCEGTRQADVLIVDGPRIAGFPVGWQSAVATGMRIPQIWAHDRSTNKLQRV